MRKDIRKQDGQTDCQASRQAGVERGEGEIVTEIEIQEGKVRRGLNARFEQR